MENRIGVSVVVLKNNNILLGRRNSNLSIGSGQWATPGGHLELGEDPINCAKRELLEETNLVAKTLKSLNWSFGPIIDNRIYYTTLYVLVTDFDGELKNNEPEKCDYWDWFELDKLPIPLFESARKLINYL